MWDLEVFDLGQYSFDLEVVFLPQEGDVIDGDMKVIKIWDVDNEAQTAKIEIEFTSQEEEMLDRFFAFLESL